MATLAEWLAEFGRKTGETPTHIVLGWEHGWGGYKKEAWPQWDGWGVVHPLDAVPAAILDQEFGGGYGANESPNLCAWSPSWVLFSDNYDGAEGLCWVPRSPIDHEPIRPGGG